jgi:hypothetical protein
LIPSSRIGSGGLTVAARHRAASSSGFTRAHRHDLTYPESFGDFRTLKKALFDLGYTTAARPLPPGILIGGSPNGSRSAAQ